MPLNPVPNHVAIIMDGNGRWAQQRGLPRLAGHERGAQSIRACVEAAIEVEVQVLTLYAFSTENWKRPASEISGLMNLLEKFLDEKTPEMLSEGIRLRAIGRIGELPAPCHRKLESAISATANNSRLTVVLALNYSGRQDILDAARRLATEAQQGEVEPASLDAAAFAARLSTDGLPDPDLLIRTSGELRLSNFLLWELAYTEIHVSPKFWPDFGKEDFLEAIADYRRRSRRFGGI